MHIEKLIIQQFRNLQSIEIHPTPQFNIFYGKNGAGKTSVLEAIYYLSLGRSFRTRLAERIIMQNSDKLTIFSKLINGNYHVNIGMERLRDGHKRMHIDQEPIQHLSLLAKKLPTQLLCTNSYNYFHEGPKFRRQFMDWGLFHVKQAFFPLWQVFQQALKQRNASLKQRIHLSELGFWNTEFAVAAEKIDILRHEYVIELQEIINMLLPNLLPEYDLVLRYSRGWPRDQSLIESLHAHKDRDLQYGFTQNGPHRADLSLYCKNIPAQDVLSQGQQKLASYALYIAQGVLYKKYLNQSPIYLIDDLPSELDLNKREKIILALRNLEAQVFITGIDPKDLVDIQGIPDTKLFHVKQGVIDCCNL